MRDKLAQDFEKAHIEAGVNLSREEAAFVSRAAADNYHGWLIEQAKARRVKPEDVAKEYSFDVASGTVHATSLESWARAVAKKTGAKEGDLLRDYVFDASSQAIYRREPIEARASNPVQGDEFNWLARSEREFIDSWNGELKTPLEGQPDAKPETARDTAWQMPEGAAPPEPKGISARVGSVEMEAPFWRMEPDDLFARSLMNGGAKLAKGAVRFSSDDAKAFVRIFQNADAGTAIEQMGIVIARFAKREAARDGAGIAERAMWDALCDSVGAKPGKAWSEKQETDFGKAFLKYFQEGIAPSVQLEAAFKELRELTGSVYNAAHFTGVEVSEPLRNVLNRLNMIGMADGQARYVQAIAELQTRPWERDMIDPAGESTPLPAPDSDLPESYIPHIQKLEAQDKARAERHIAKLGESAPELAKALRTEADQAMAFAEREVFKAEAVMDFLSCELS